MMGTMTLMLLYPVIFFCISILIGVYAYRDARDRGMNAVLWTLIVVLAPAFIGFIIYLIVRGSYSNMKCPKCETSVTEEYILCPNCGAKLKATCPNCSMPVEAGWKVCPRCAEQLTGDYHDISVPVKKKDKLLGKILLMIILIPVLLIVIMVMSFSIYTGSSGVTNFTESSADEYLQGNDNPQIEAWLDNCGEESGKAYVLRYESISDEQESVHYLIYIPGLSEHSGMSAGTSHGLLGSTLELELTNSEITDSDTLLLFTCRGETPSRIKIIYNDEKLDCEITDVNYPLN